MSSADPIEAIDRLSDNIRELIQMLNPVMALLASVNDLNSKFPPLEDVALFLESIHEMVGIQRKALKWQEMFG